jgi:hypothetical protein
MSDTEPPVRGARSAEPATEEAKLPSVGAARTAFGNLMGMPAIQLIAVAAATVALMSFVSSQVSRTEEKLGKTEDKLTALIKEKSAGLSAEIKEAGNKSTNQVDEARQRFLNAVTQLTDTYEKLGKTTSEVGVITTEKIPTLTSSLKATETKLANTETKLVNTESKLADTDSKLNTTIDSFGGKLTSIKSHEEKYIESFGLKIDKDLIATTIRGRILAVPQDPAKFKILRNANFYQTRTPIGPGYGWAPTKKAFYRASN